MVNTSDLLSLGTVPLAAVSTTLVTAAAIGVPEILLPPLKVNPAGNGAAVNVIGVLPVAVMV